VTASITVREAADKMGVNSKSWSKSRKNDKMGIKDIFIRIYI